jgi:hypothetical protein
VAAGIRRISWLIRKPTIARPGHVLKLDLWQDFLKLRSDHCSGRMLSR